jgi:DNA-binding response OmpR family regulator
VSAAVTFRPCCLTIGNLRLDFHDQTFIAPEMEKPIELSRSEFKLLELLMRNAGTPVSRATILSEVFKRTAIFSRGGVESNVVEVYISYLREKIGAALIATVRGQGYCFNAGASA